MMAQRDLGEGCPPEKGPARTEAPAVDTAAHAPAAIQGWNPLMETVRKQMRQDMRVPDELIRQRKASLWLVRATLAVRSNLGATVLGTAAVLMAVAAPVVAFTPGALIGGARDVSEVVAGIAAATAFSALVVGAMAIPAATAIQLGPGYTTDVAGRKGPWLVALAQVVLMVALFTLAASAPTPKAAVVGALAAGSLFAVSWLIGLGDSWPASCALRVEPL